MYHSKPFLSVVQLDGMHQGEMLSGILQLKHAIKRFGMYVVLGCNSKMWLSVRFMASLKGCTCRFVRSLPLLKLHGNENSNCGKSDKDFVLARKYDWNNWLLVSREPELEEINDERLIIKSLKHGGDRLFSYSCGQHLVGAWEAGVFEDIVCWGWVAMLKAFLVEPCISFGAPYFVIWRQSHGG